MKNTITERVYDFLKNYPPFNLLPKNELREISNEVKIIYKEKGKTIFKNGDKNHQDFYIVRNGAIGLYKDINIYESLVDICDSGDLFGLRPLISKEKYILNAMANEESIIYAIPIDIFKTASEKNSKIQKYLMISFASNTYDPYSSEVSGSVFGDYIPNNNQDLSSFQTISYTKKPITCSDKYSLKEAAIIMSKHKIGCIIVVNDEKFPVGIITNSDIKNKIATGLFPIDTCVKNIMSSPVATFTKNITVAEAQLQMIKRGIGNLCITKDGTNTSKIKGILTNHDLIVSLGNNPSSLLKEIKRANRNRKLRSARHKTNILLKRYLEQNIPISHVIKIVSEINNAVTVRAIELAIKKMETSPPCPFTWIALGSQGRNEQLLFTDQDNAIIFEDVATEKYTETKNYFLQLAKLVNEALHKIGFEYCPAEMMASNEKWCKSLTEWKEQFDQWILHPDEKAVLLSQVFFDFNHVYGSDELVSKLSDNIFKTLNKTSIFYSYLSQDAIKSPSPLSFFKQFLVEVNGEHKDQFNIKNRAIMPLVDTARLLTLIKQVKGINNTALRFEELAKIEPQNKELFKSCSYAFKALTKFKTKEGLLNNNSGKFIELSTLSKEEKMKLKRCFKPIREIQDLVKNRLQMGNFK